MLQCFQCSTGVFQRLSHSNLQICTWTNVHLVIPLTLTVYTIHIIWVVFDPILPGLNILTNINWSQFTSIWMRFALYLKKTHLYFILDKNDFFGLELFFFNETYNIRSKISEILDSTIIIRMREWVVRTIGSHQESLSLLITSIDGTREKFFKTKVKHHTDDQNNYSQESDTTAT